MKVLYIILFCSIQAFAQVAANSDVRENELIEQCLTAMGGKQAWDNTKIIQWDFFGKRRLIWDKFNQDVIIEKIGNTNPYKIWVNLTTKQGKAFVNNTWVEHPDSIKVWMNKGYEIWVNDAYWLVMPYKLKDNGVNLKYLGYKKNSKQADCEVIELTFNNVGVTPENKYHIYFDNNTHLICEWSYFEKFTDNEPKMTTPWENYQKYGNILLSSNRGKFNLDIISVR